jgi:dipeptidyl aminopeptidase/acylaminoacyl peptidase
MTYPLSRYLSVQQAYAPGFLEGERLAFISTMTGLPQLYGVSLAKDSELRWPDPLTFESDRVLGAWPSPDGRRIVYARDAGGDENAQLFLLDAGGGLEAPLTAGYEGVMHAFGSWLPDGQSFLFAANRRRADRFDIYHQALQGEARVVFKHDEPGYLRQLVLSPDGKRVTLQRAVSSSRHDLFEIELETGEVRKLTPPDEAAIYEPAGYDESGRTLYLATDSGSDFNYLAALDLASLELTPLEQPGWDVELAELSPDRKRLAYVVNEAGASRLYCLMLETGKALACPQTARVAGVVGMMDGELVFSPDSRQLAFSFTSSGRSSDVFVWNLEENAVSAATRSSHAGLPVESFVEPRLIRYSSFDGLEIPAWLYEPKGQSGPIPVVVIVHGGPESQTRPSFNFLAQYLAHHGYAVLAPNVRGSTGYGKTYSHLDDVEKRMDAVADLAHAATWLKAQPRLDGERLTVYGGSYGGFMVLAALSHYPELFTAGIDIVGISNFVTFLKNTSGYRRAHREAEYGSLARDRDFLESISPLNRADRIRGPLMVVHGANDPRVPLSEAEQLVEALESRGVPTQFLVFDDEGHGIVKLENKLIAYGAVVAFLEKHLRA